MGWLKKAESDAPNWRDITARYRAISEKLKGSDPLGRGLVAYIDELKDILRDMAWGDGSGRGGEFMRVMNDATGKLGAVKESILRAQDDKFAGDRVGSRGQMENAERYLADSYGHIIRAHGLLNGGGADMGKGEFGSECPPLRGGCIHKNFCLKIGVEARSQGATRLVKDEKDIGVQYVIWHTDCNAACIHCVCKK
jgi:hypothetical protein